MAGKHSCYGLILCGGKSTRMGLDKCLLAYHEKPQCYHLYDLIQEICEETFISCHPSQLNIFSQDYQILPDLDEFESTGPMGGLLTATHSFPGKDLLVIGCDYPLLSRKGLLDFLDHCRHSHRAAAFYHSKEDVYEPLLGWYSRDVAGMLTRRFDQHEYSLQHFLRAIHADQYEPADPAVMVSVDTPEAMQKVREQLLKTQILNA